MAGMCLDYSPPQEVLDFYHLTNFLNICIFSKVLTQLKRNWMNFRWPIFMCEFNQNITHLHSMVLLNNLKNDVFNERKCWFSSPFITVTKKEGESFFCSRSCHTVMMWMVQKERSESTSFWRVKIYELFSSCTTIKHIRAKLSTAGFYMEDKQCVSSVVLFLRHHPVLHLIGILTFSFCSVNIYLLVVNIQPKFTVLMWCMYCTLVCYRKKEALKTCLNSYHFSFIQRSTTIFNFQLLLKQCHVHMYCLCTRPPLI